MMWWHDGAWGPSVWILMTLMMIVFWGGLLALAVWLVRTLGASRNFVQTPPVATPTRTLLHSGSTPRR